MKRILALILSAALVIAMLASCTDNANGSGNGDGSSDVGDTETDGGNGGIVIDPSDETDDQVNHIGGSN